MSFNKIFIIGNLGKDPELRYTPQGTPVCDFSMASNEKRKNKQGELVDVTTWFRVTLWGRMAETASQYLEKGRLVFIEGTLRVEDWVDREGKARYTLEVNASDMKFISSNPNSQGGDRAPAGNPPNQNPPPDDGDDIPF